MSNVHITALPTIQDCSLKGQVNRWNQRPLRSINKELNDFSSFKGRGYCVKEFAHTLVREPYRQFKNVMLIWEKIYQFVRNFFETVFREDNHSWKQLGTEGKELLGRIASALVRPLTYLLDLVKLAAGVFVPAAAIYVPAIIEQIA